MGDAAVSTKLSRLETYATSAHREKTRRARQKFNEGVIVVHLL
jgi:hypothetical protein